jgi:chromosome segregation ATPase
MKHAAFRMFSLLLLTAACAKAPAPVAAPSGEFSGYAERYPARLTDVRTRFAEDETAAKTAFTEWKAYPDALKNPSYEHVEQVVERADQTGRSSAYSEASLEGEAVQRFFRDEKDPLRQKVAGGVSYAAKQKECSEDLGGAAVVAMERGVEKQLEERLQSYSEAHRYIEDHAEELGKANVDTLEKQADAIARTSHVVHVRLELYRRELEGLLADASSVRSTLDKSVRENDEVIANAGSSKQKKAAAERRKGAAQEARARLDADVEQAQQALTDMEQRIGAVQREYDTALDALLDDLKQRATAAKQ